MSDLIEDGVPLYDALLMLKNKDGEAVYGRVFIKQMNTLVDNMKKSASVTESLTGLVPGQDLMIINAAEQSGQLSDGLKMLVDMIVKSNAISSNVKKSLVTPVLLFVVVLFVIMGYSMQVFPTFLGVLPITQWPSVTKSLYGFGTYLSEGGLVTILLSSFVITAIIRASMPILYGKYRTLILDKIPPYNYYRQIQLGIFLRMLSTLMLNNIPMVDAIELIKSKSSIWLRSHLNSFNDNMKKGKSYKDSLDTGLVTKEMLLMINIYSGLDSFTVTVKKMADEIDFKINSDVNRLSVILKNVSLVVLASAVIWIFGAIFSLVDKLGAGY